MSSALSDPPRTERAAQLSVRDVSITYPARSGKPPFTALEVDPA